MTCKVEFMFERGGGKREEEVYVVEDGRFRTCEDVTLGGKGDFTSIVVSADPEMGRLA